MSLVSYYSKCSLFIVDSLYIYCGRFSQNRQISNPQNIFGDRIILFQRLIYINKNNNPTATAYKTIEHLTKTRNKSHVLNTKNVYFRAQF